MQVLRSAAGSRRRRGVAAAPLERTLSHGATWSGVNTLVTKLAGIAVTVVVVRIVSPHDFGVFSVALVVYAIVSSFGELGLSACIARRDVEPDLAGPVVAALSMISCFVLAVATALLASPIAGALGAPEAASAIRVLSASIFLSSLTTVSAAMLVRDFRQGRLFAATAIAFVPSNAVLVLLALHGDGAMAFAWSRLVGQIVAGIVIVAAVRPWSAPRWNRVQAVRVLHFGLPLAGANLLNYVLLNADYAFIGHLLGPALLGTYTLAFNVASWSTSVLGATINGVAMPAFSGMHSDPARLEQTVGRWLRRVSLIAFPVGALTVVMSADLIGVLYGPKWSAAGPVLAVLAVYGALFVVTLLLSNLLVGIGLTRRVFAVQALWLVALLPCVGLGVAWLGIEGAAMAHVAVIILVVIPVYLWALKPAMKSVPLRLFEAVAGPIAAALLAGGAAYASSFTLAGSLLRLAVGGTCGVAVYVLVAWPILRAELPARIGARFAWLGAGPDSAGRVHTIERNGGRHEFRR